MNSSTIVLDERYSRALLRKALHDGLAKKQKEYKYIRNIDGEKFNIARVGTSILSGHAQQKLSQIALEYLLLYPNIYLYHANDIFDVTELQNNMSLKFIEPRIYEAESLSYLGSEAGYEAAQVLKPVLIPALSHIPKSENSDLLKINDENYDIFIKACHNAGGNWDIGKTQQFKEYLLYIAKKASKGHISREQIHTVASIGSLTSISAISENLVDSVGLIEESEKLEAASAFSWAIPKSYIKGNMQDTKLTANNEIRACYYIFLQEVDAFPQVRTIQDVLRLRGDKRVNNWREAIYGWTYELQQGSVNAEKKMRHEIRMALSDMQSLGEMRKISGLIIIIALPLAIAEMMMGIAGPGVILTGWHFGLEVNSHYIENKHKWLLLGRNG